MHNTALVTPTAEELIHIIQGDYAVSHKPNVVLTTVLGSCVATCLFDPVTRIGGMNHFLLPGAEGRDGAGMTFGVHAMELLINGLLKKKGADRRRLQAKLFGGAAMIDGLSDIGAKNAKFALDFLDRENIPCVGESLGGVEARRIRFEPATGRARQRLIGDARKMRAVEAPPQQPAPQANDVELF